MSLEHDDLKYFLDSKVDKYNCDEFIELDPISIPHKFTLKEDIEIAGFLSATIAWGNRKAILKSANQLIQWMDGTPYDFIMNHTKADLKPFYNFVYRTFNGDDCVFYLESLQNIYKECGGMEKIVTDGYIANGSIKESIKHFRNHFFSLPHQKRTEKHFANVDKNSAAKRLNMFYRWMVRSDDRSVDFGLWNDIKSADLMMPLDIHSGTIARKLEILQRNANDWKSVIELTDNLKRFDESDPVKYDFALFGLGVNGDFE